MSKETVILCILLIISIVLALFIGYDDFIVRSQNAQLLSDKENTTQENSELHQINEKLQYKIDNFPCDTTESITDSVSSVSDKAGKKTSEAGNLLADAAGKVGESVKITGDLLNLGGHLAGIW